MIWGWGRKTWQRRSGLSDLVPDGVADDIGSGVEIQLAHKIGAVGIGGFDADAEHLGDFFGSLAFGDELDDFAFARGQLRLSWVSGLR